MRERIDVFSSRWGMMLAMLGMAIGTGNIWRFPRIAAANGGGSFLVAWVVFLLLWSIPLILVEFAMGRAARTGPVGAFARIAGKGFAWMGAWVAWVATAIMFYYAVVMAWTLRYLWGAITGEVMGPGGVELWERFAWTPNVLVVHALALGLGAWVVARGVRGIERAARILIPSLFLLVVALAIRAVTLPGAGAGLAYLFTPTWSDLANYRIWLEALTQNAWDTGAGWGLILAYAVYMRSREDTTLNAFLLGFGNNSVSLLAGIMVLCTVFALAPDAAAQLRGQSNVGLTFMWVPELFQRMPGGRFFIVLFFLALVFAAWTSLVAMIELATRVVADAGVNRKLALGIVVGGGFLLGVPSALSEFSFENQDFVWGVGLMVSGLFFAIAVLRFGVRRFRETLVNAPGAQLRIGVWWEWAMRLVVVQALVLIVWWFYQVRGEPAFGMYGLGTVFLQWAVALGIFIAANGWLARRAAATAAAAEVDESARTD